jgi:hypothetical protein
MTRTACTRPDGPLTPPFGTAMVLLLATGLSRDV